jgi:hypothetical protein
MTIIQIHEEEFAALDPFLGWIGESVAFSIKDE